ncbi:ABC transporter ATP-binding protein [Citreimonas salinaria]|uniref:Peptide/nickel transport system ATP-binding protein n=1 Tax=Citreimonas salinaria TaxID=321339 RepID=A0A1H3HN40_9RHOB|nr:ABC transporter ATP-binding protein [Citreimonas salinaria]SDY16897.1 peptide/nickel transport system ATP-binding protein [Citreimonas salinaria]
MTRLASSFWRKSPGAREGQRRSPPSPDTGAALLELDDLSVAIAGKPVLRKVRLAIAPGEIVALTGESGSGKSMTALAAMGLLPPGARTEGAIRLAGRDLITLGDRALCAVRGAEIGMIFQEPMTALNPVQRIGDQVAETIRIHAPRTPRAEVLSQAARTLARVGLPAERVPPTRYPHELSGGQRQRVGIAMAIALRPRMLIADEPTTALDVTTQARILGLLRRLVQEDGMALMMITHDLAVVADMADRIAVMNEGRIVEEAPTTRLFREMRHPYTRALFEASRHRASLPPRPAGEPLLQVHDAYRSYALPRTRLLGSAPRHEAVRGVSFDIGLGERVGLVGESGCGKSTLTRAILGLEPLQRGSITLDGRDVATDPAARRRMQVVFQDPYGSFNPRHRVRRLITEPFHLLDDPPKGAARDDAVAEALEAVGLDPSVADRTIHAFSGGQRQRLAIARALIIRPDLLIFDEAVSALDVRVRARILDLVADLSTRFGLAYLFISHDLSVVRGITDRVMVMQAGEIVERGPTDAVFDAPRHAYTQTLMAAAPRLPEIGQDEPVA